MIGSLSRARPAACRLLGGLAMLMSASVLSAQDSTSTLRYRSVVLTPLLTAAGEAFWRQRNLESDIGSPYNAIPFDNTTAAKTSEFRATGRHSKIGVLAEAQANADSITAMWEMDFLAAGTTSKSDENDGYAVRIRQAWAMLTTSNKTMFAVGQMWSLMTSNKQGVLPRSEQIPLTIDAQYAAGYDWARQAAFRIAKPGKLASVAFSLEGAQTSFAARLAPAGFVVGQPGGSQLNSLNNYSADIGPDAIGKISFDPHGRGHYELKLLGRLLRDRIVDPTNVAGGSRSLTGTAGGVGFAAMVPIAPGVRDVADVGLSGLFGTGLGRYGTSQLPDATIAADTSLKPIKSAHLLFSLELHPSRGLDVYNYDGFEYADRTSFVNAAGKGVGYGSPLNDNSGCEVEGAATGPYGPTTGGPCNADTRAIQQFNLGFWYRFYRGSGGTISWGMQYSLTRRAAWVGLGHAPSADENMVFNSFRYVLP